MKKSRLLAAACIFISTLCISTNAAALLIEYTVGTYEALGVGATINTNFDEVNLFETTQSFDLIKDTPTQGLLNTGSFVVDFTGSGSTGNTVTSSASRSFDLTVASSVYNSSISQNYTVLIGNNEDSITFNTGSTVTIDLGANGMLDITPNSVATASYAGGTNTINEINGTFLLHDVPAIPIPPTVWLFGSGLLGLVGMARRKKSA